MVPIFQMQNKEQLAFFISWTTEVGVPTDFCTYFWQSQYRNSLIHFKHVIILRNLLRLEMEKPKVWRTCWADITCPACDQHQGDRSIVASTESPMAAGWSPYMYIRKGRTAAQRRKLFWGLPYRVSVSKVLFSPACKVCAGCTGCDRKWMSTGKESLGRRMWQC